MKKAHVEKAKKKAAGIVLPTLAILTAALLLAVLPTEAEAAVYTDTVRLHILANSDSEEDQKLKLQIRDFILAEYGGLLSRQTDTDGAENALRERLPEIEKKVKSELTKRGSDDAVRITLSVEWYDTRDYETFTLPAGYYTSLRVLIGNAAGHNWWCVLYPPMCLSASTDQPADSYIGGYSDAECRLIGGKYRIRFKSLEIVSDAVRKISQKS